MSKDVPTCLSPALTFARTRRGQVLPLSACFSCSNEPCARGLPLAVPLGSGGVVRGGGESNCHITTAALMTWRALGRLPSAGRSGPGVVERSVSDGVCYCVELAAWPSRISPGLSNKQTNKKTPQPRCLDCIQASAWKPRGLCSLHKASLASPGRNALWPA